MILILLLIIGAVIAFGYWRGFTSIQWIWLMAGGALALLLIWFLIVIFLIGPEMRRMGPPGG